jgi:heme/copper-type cytochrome/quinol oxidase subunit 4
MSHEMHDAGDDVMPGFMDAAQHTVREGIQGYLIGLVLAALLTAASFYVVHTDLIWGPGIPVALVVLAIAQIGVHLVFFLHLTTAPDNTNNGAGAGVRRADCRVGPRRFSVDHGPSEPQHAAHASDDADAAVTVTPDFAPLIRATCGSRFFPLKPGGIVRMQMHTNANVRRRTGKPA